jgi:hypothetical protein
MHFARACGVNPFRSRHLPISARRFRRTSVPATAPVLRFFAVADCDFAESAFLSVCPVFNADLIGARRHLRLNAALERFEAVIHPPLELVKVFPQVFLAALHKSHLQRQRAQHLDLALIRLDALLEAGDSLAALGRLRRHTISVPG